jgi:ElaB/YqjD/DUF883 family membrane-anchored ribosome-binding protein
MRNTKAVKDDAQQLLTDLRALGLEAEKLIEGSASEFTDTALSRVREQFRSAQERFSELYGTAREKTLAGAKYTDEAVRANPYQSVAIGIGVGLLAGFLIGRSSHSE